MIVTAAELILPRLLDDPLPKRMFEATVNGHSEQPTPPRARLIVKETGRNLFVGANLVVAQIELSEECLLSAAKKRCGLKDPK